MSGRRSVARLSAVLAGLALASSCGDGDAPTAPPPPPEPARPTTVTVSPATAELTALRATVQLAAEVRDQNARVMADATVTWSSSETSVATASASGLVTAVGNGTATITAASGSASGSATVTVAPEVSRVAVSPTAATMTALGDTLRMAAAVLDLNGREVPGVAVSWTSGDSTVAVVDSTGLVTAVGAGETTVTATSGTVSASASVTVMQTTSTVAVSPARAALQVGDTLRLRASATDANGHPVAGAEFYWASSDSAVAAVGASGLVRGIAEGTATITAASASAAGMAEIIVETDPDRAALAALYQATDGPNWVNTDNWLTDRPLSEWYGVEVDGDGNVSRLRLGNNGLTGRIPPQLGLLNGLTVLDLKDNRVAATSRTTTSRLDPGRETLVQLPTPAPSAIREPTQARDRTGGLDGRIPAELGSLANLEFLSLSGNDLSGPIPPELGNLAHLKWLFLGDNRLSGRIPVTVKDLSSLTFLYLNDNDLSGPIPSELESLANLKALALWGNDLSGPIPSELGNLDSLEGLYLTGNNLSGPIPSELGNLTSLRHLFLWGNRLSGPIPPELGSLAALEVLVLQWNELSGSIPESLLGLRAMEIFRFNGNADLCAPGTTGFVVWLDGIEQVSGPYCNEADRGVLEHLHETAGGPDWTNSSGWLETPALDEWYGVTANSLGRVEVLDLTGNGLAGRLPASLGNLAEMTQLRIADNTGLTGHVPLLLANLSLRALHYAGTGLCAPAHASFRDWLDTVESHDGTGVECPPGAWSPAWEAYLAGETVDATYASRLPPLFRTALQHGLHEELDAALRRLVRETPSLPTSSAVPEARLAAAVAETLGPYEWPEAHPWATEFPGLPAMDARRVDGTVTVDASRGEFPADASRRERHLPLGFYAPPSTVVTIEVPASHATGELAVSVGELHDNLGQGYAAQPVWRRAPWLRREFRVADGHTAVANAYGGSIALIVPPDYSGTIPVTVRGAIPMAVYTAGESNAAEWFADLDAGAPQAIIQKAGGIRFVISAESARSIDDPGEVSAFWDGFRRHHAELSGEPVPRAFESVWIFDPQVGHGYANAGRVRLNYPLHGEAWVLVPGTAEGREYIATLRVRGPRPHVIPPSTGYSPPLHGVDWWLFGHELGHQWQSEDWRGHGITEVGVNLFTMYTLNYYLFSGDNFNVYTERATHGCAAPLDHAALANRRWSTSDDCEKLALYRQLIAEFGWDAMKRVFHSYYDPAFPRSTYGGALDGFAIRFSAIVRRDLVGFFRHWGYPLSGSAAATIRGFGHEQWLPPGW